MNNEMIGRRAGGRVNGPVGMEGIDRRSSKAYAAERQGALTIGLQTEVEAAFRSIAAQPAALRSKSSETREQVAGSKANAE